MKKLVLALALVLGATNMNAQDYDLQGLAKIIEKADEVGRFHSGRAKIVFNDGTICYIDKKGNIVFRDDENLISGSGDFSDDGLIPFGQNVSPFKYGYFDVNGNVAIVPKYGKAYAFNNGVAIVQDNYKYGAIDKKGNVVIPLVYKVLGGGRCIFNGKYTIGIKEGKMGFVDKSNNFYPQYFNGLPAEREGQVGGLYLDRRVSEDSGLYPIPKGEKWSTYTSSPNAQWGYHNHLGSVIIPCTFDSADLFSEGLAKVSRNGKFGYIDTKGEIVIPLQEELKEAGVFHEGFALIKNNGLFGYIDKTGKVVIPCAFKYAQDFKEGMALVGNGVKRTFINKEGKTITDYVFDNNFTNQPFSDGLALVSFQGKWGYVDKQGNTTFTNLTIGGTDEEPPFNAVEGYVKEQSSKQEVIDVTEQKPSFKGGEEQFRKWLAANVHYPELALENGIKGTVVASVVIEQDGSIGEVKIKKGVDPLLDKETIRVFKSMPRWNPGIQNGNPVRALLDLPLNFNFTEE